MGGAGEELRPDREPALPQEPQPGASVLTWRSWWPGGQLLPGPGEDPQAAGQARGGAGGGDQGGGAWGGD